MIKMKNLLIMVMVVTIIVKNIKIDDLELRLEGRDNKIEELLKEREF
jgi:hypothetical protein